MFVILKAFKKDFASTFFKKYKYNYKIKIKSRAYHET